MGAAIDDLRRGPARVALELESAQFLTLAAQIFTIDTQCVREIIEYSQMNGMPMMPDFLCGVINLRGAAIPVLDLGLRLGGSAKLETPRTCIIMLEVS
ncbi:chemotaxis protein CheW [Pseudomonas protegens]|uniref:chemotaxis protein CheW n=1 Tax=Pseudomonas protegens TaxID=380021 RepID=UPI003906381A